MSDILRRIIADAEPGDLLEVLSEQFSPTDLQSLLLEVYARRAARESPARILDQYQTNRFVHPSPNDPQLLQTFDRLAFTTAVGFTPIELAPVCPLGTVSAVAPLSQNNTISTVRNTELVSDLTNVLALECAVRRRARSADPVRLCASHRVLRTKKFTGTGAFAHFRLFGMCSAGRATANYGFEIEELRQHISFYLRLLSSLSDAGSCIPALQVQLLDFGGRYQERFEQIIAPLQAMPLSVPLSFTSERHPTHAYYDGVRFQIYAAGDTPTAHQIADGGVTRWTQTLLSNNKERLVISGIGSERVCNLFGSRIS